MKYSDEQISKLVEGIYSGIITEYELPKTLYLAIAEYLKKAVEKGFGGSLIDFTDTPSYELLSELQENIYMFSAAKTFKQVKDMTSLLVGENGKIQPFGVFKKAALETYEQYNVNWLRTEYDTAIGQAQSAERWQQIESKKDTLPMLKYSAIIDANTSDICKPLDGITLPVNDKFWNTHAPLNHFNCRCVLLQVGEEKETNKEKVKEVEKEMNDKMQPLFKMNPGKDKVIFDDKHPYFEVAPKDKEFAKNNFDLPMP